MCAMEEGNRWQQVEEDRERIVREEKQKVESPVRLIYPICLEGAMLPDLLSYLPIVLKCTSSTADNTDHVAMYQDKSWKNLSLPIQPIWEWNGWNEDTREKSFSEIQHERSALSASNDEDLMKYLNWKW